MSGLAFLVMCMLEDFGIHFTLALSFVLGTCDWQRLFYFES